MKKRFFIIAVFLSALIAQAKDITIAIRGITPFSNDHTEISWQGVNSFDSLIVNPAINATAIYLSLTNMQGTVHQLYCIPATSNDILSFDPSTLPTGYMLEIADDRGFVFRTFGN